MTRRSVLRLLRSAGVNVPDDVYTYKTHGIWKLLWSQYEYRDRKFSMYRACVQGGQIIVVCRLDLDDIKNAWRIIR